MHGREAGRPVPRAGRRFTEHHALLCRLHRARITGFSAAVDDLDQRIAGKAARWQREAGLLTTVPGFGEAGHLAAYPDAEFTPHAVGRVLGRSSGAVANALDRLTAVGRAQLTGEHPRRYEAAPAAQSFVAA